MTEQEFKECIMPLYNKMYGYALSLLKNENDTADCMQDSFAKLWESRSRLEIIENKCAYCLVTIKRTALDRLRKQQTMITEDYSAVNLPVQEENPELLSENRDSLKIVTDIIDSLPQTQRDIIRMSAFTGLSNAEIREATGLTDDNVRVILSRTRKKLRDIMSSIK